MAAEPAQISQRRGVVRGPSHSYLSPPNDGVFDLPLEGHQRVVQVEWARGLESPRRKTVDWTWVATIESRFKPVSDV